MAEAAAEPFSFVRTFSSPEEAEREVEKWREEGARGRPASGAGGFWAAGWAAGGVAVVAVVAVVTGPLVVVVAVAAGVVARTATPAAPPR